MSENNHVEETMTLLDELSKITQTFQEKYGEIVFHILPAEDWKKAQDVGVYSPDSIRNEGFIHCSRIDQIERTLAVHFIDQDDLLLLSIAVSKVDAEIRDEDLYDAGQTFPHIYGPLNLDAVVGVTAYDRD